MRTWLYWGVVIVVTIACLVVVANFSSDYRVIEGIIIFSVIPSIPIYLYRRRNEKMISEYLEKHDSQKTG
jgi:hypothetical protein